MEQQYAAGLCEFFVPWMIVQLRSNFPDPSADDRSRAAWLAAFALGNRSIEETCSPTWHGDLRTVSDQDVRMASVARTAGQRLLVAEKTFGELLVDDAFDGPRAQGVESRQLTAALSDRASDFLRRAYQKFSFAFLPVLFAGDHESNAETATNLGGVERAMIKHTAAGFVDVPKARILET
jgi:hypothetical protein